MSCSKRTRRHMRIARGARVLQRIDGIAETLCRCKNVVTSTSCVPLPRLPDRAYSSFFYLSLSRLFLFLIGIGTIWLGKSFNGAPLQAQPSANSLLPLLASPFISYIGYTYVYKE